MALTPTSKNNPCPICENTSGKCRQSREDLSYWQCMTYADTKKGEIIGRWKSLGATKNKQWAQFRLDNSVEWTEEKRREWQASNRKKVIDLAAIAADKKRKSLSATDRNEQYLKLFAELKAANSELAIAHKEDLVRRGLTKSQIELLGAVSVRQYQKIQGNYSELLPGVNTRDKQIISIGDGYLYPVRDAAGLIVGCQIRLMAFNSGLEAPQKSTEKTNKYAWLSGGRGKGLLQLFPKGCNIRGEVPLAIYYPDDVTTIAIGISEGTGVKPLLATQRMGMPFIGAAGGNHASSPESLKLALREIKAKLWDSVQNTAIAGNSTFTIKIFPDAGSVINPSVMVQLRATTKLLTELNLAVQFAWWGQVTKAAGDIDEIDPETRNIKYLTPEEFWTTADKAKQQWEKEERVRVAQEPLRKLTYAPDIETSSRYIPHDIINQLPLSGLIGLNAPKGSGKSVLIKALIKVAKLLGCTILSITPRIALGREQAVKWEITWIDDNGDRQSNIGSTEKQVAHLAKRIEETEEKIEEYRQTPNQLELIGESTPDLTSKLKAEIDVLKKQIDSLNKSAYNTLGLCWDSLWRTKDRDMKNSLIIIDEAELGFTHLATSRTCSGRRAEILKIFSNKLVECLTNGGRVILSDADLTNIPIDYIRALLPFKMKPFIVTNTYKGDETKWQIDFYRGGSRGTRLAQTMTMINMGAHLAITTDSQAEAEALERKILQEFPELCSFIQDGDITDQAKKGTPSIVRIDRKTTECKAGQYFIQHPNEEILRWQPRIIIYTPSMGVGVSIDEHVKRGDTPYFDCVVGLFFGVIEPSQCRQQLARIRANVPRLVWAMESGMGGDGCPSFFPDEVNRTTAHYQHWGVNILDIARANVHDYIESGEGDDGDYFDEIARLRAEHFDDKSRIWNNPHIDLFAKLKARNNYGRAHLAKLLAEELIEEGHTIVILGGGGNEITKEVSEIKDVVKWEDAARINASPEISADQAKEILRKAVATQAERDSAQKALLKNELPGIEISEEFIYKAVTGDRGKWLRQHKLFWYCQNIEAAKERDRARYFKKLKSFAKGTAFAPDIQMDLPKIEAILESGVLEVIDLTDLDKHYRECDTVIQECFKKCVKASKKIKLAFGTRSVISEKSQSLKTVHEMLRRVGIAFQCVSRGDARGRVYMVNKDSFEDTDRLAVLDAMSTAWNMLQQNNKECASLSEEELENLQKKYCYIFDPQNPQNPLPTTDKTPPPVTLCLKTNMSLLAEEKPEGECASMDQSPTETEYEYLEEKAKDGDNSSNLVTESDIGRLYKGRQVAEAFKDGVEAVKGLLGGLGGEIERFSAMEAFEAAFPEQLAELMAIAPDCWQWCWM